MANNRKNTGLQKNPRKNPGGTPISIIHTSLEVMPFHRTTQDMDSWRSALRQAESLVPNRVKLYDLYADVVLDPHVQAVTRKIVESVVSARWGFNNRAGKAVEAVKQIISSIGFSDMLAEIVGSDWWGYLMDEPTFYKDFRGRWQMNNYRVPYKHMRPELGVIAYQQYGDEGINIREGIYAKTILEVGDPKNLGLHLKAAPFYILKRGGVGDWGMFVQVFGMPVVDAVWDGMDETQKQKLVEAIKVLGSGGALVRPAGTQVQLLQNNNSANGQLQESFVTMCDKQISKVYLGTTETTEASNSSGYAQSKTHEGQDERKYDAYIEYVKKVLNSRFIPIMEAAGIDTEGGEFVIEGEEDDLNKTEMFEIIKTMAMDKSKGGLGVPVDDDFFYEFTGVPKPDNYEELKRKQEEKEQPPAPAPAPPAPGKKPKPAPGDKQNLSFLRRLLTLVDFFGQAPESGAIRTKNGNPHTNDEEERLPDGIPLREGAGAGRSRRITCCEPLIKLADPDNFSNDALIKRVWEAGGSLAFDFGLFSHTADTLLNGFKKGWESRGDGRGVQLVDAPGFEYGVDDPALLTAFEQNIFRFSAGKTLAEVAELNRLFRQATSFREFYELAKAKVDVFNKTWLETEYNTAILTGEAAATYHRLLAQSDIFPYWEYRTVGDSHVRPEHRALEGLILPYNDPRWNKLFPPNGWNCRCYIVPRLASEFDKSQLDAMRARADAYLESEEFKRAKGSGWGVNRAKTAEIFTASQQYITKLPGMAAKKINALQASDYGLQSYSQAKKVATANAPQYEGEAQAWYDALGEEKAVRDYHNRPLALEQKSFTRHVNKKDNRVQYLSAMQQAVREPDEVWINGPDLNDLVYVKYYQDITMIVIADIRKSTASEVSTWFPLHEKKAVINDFRRGILILKK